MQFIRPSLTIVIPTHNRRELLASALESIRQQSQWPAEVVIVDDGSDLPVSVPAVRSALGNDISLKLVRNDKPQGGWAAKNAGAANASGEIVTFLDDDDLLMPDFVRWVCGTFAKYSEYGVFFVGVKAFGTDELATQMGVEAATERLLQVTEWTQAEDNVLLFKQGLTRHLTESVPMPFQRPAVRTSVWQTLGGFREYPTCWEGDWAIRASLATPVGLLRYPGHLWRVSGQGYFSGRDLQKVQMKVKILINQQLCSDPALSSHRELFVAATAQARCAYAGFLLRRNSEFLAGIYQAFLALRSSPTPLTARRLISAALRR